MAKNCIRCGAVNPPAYQRERKFCSKGCSHVDWIEKNPGRRILHQQKYDKSEHGKAKRKTWEQENTESIAAKQHEKYEANREHLIAQAAKFAEANPDAVKGYKQKYAGTERGKQVAHENRWRRIAREHAAEGSFTKAEFLALCEKTYGRCVKCLSKPDVLEADHVMPLSKGGSNSIENIQPLCRTCNAAKGATHRDYRFEFLCQPVDLMFGEIMQ